MDRAPAQRCRRAVRDCPGSRSPTLVGPRRCSPIGDWGVPRRRHAADRRARDPRPARAPARARARRGCVGRAGRASATARRPSCAPPSSATGCSPTTRPTRSSRSAPTAAITYVSPACGELIGHEPERDRRAPAARLRPPRRPPRGHRGAPARRPSRAAPITVTSRLRHREGHYVWIEARVRRVLDAEHRRADRGAGDRARRQRARRRRGCAARERRAHRRRRAALPHRVRGGADRDGAVRPRRAASSRSTTRSARSPATRARSSRRWASPISATRPTPAATRR